MKLKEIEVGCRQCIEGEDPLQKVLNMIFDDGTNQFYFSALFVLDGSETAQSIAKRFEAFASDIKNEGRGHV